MTTVPVTPTLPLQMPSYDSYHRGHNNDDNYLDRQILQDVHVSSRQTLDSDNFDENYEYTCSEEDPPKYFLKDEDEALSDHSMYLWYCPCCKETFTTCSD